LHFLHVVIQNNRHHLSTSSTIFLTFYCTSSKFSSPTSIVWTLPAYYCSNNLSKLSFTFFWNSSFSKRYCPYCALLLNRSGLALRKMIRSGASNPLSAQVHHSKFIPLAT